jgi:uncharacterized membrane protein
MKDLLIKISLPLFLYLFCLLPISSAFDQALNLRIDPSIFLLNLKQGGSWASSVKIDNNNNKDLSYIVSLVDFKKNEKGDFSPTLDSLRRADKEEGSDIDRYNLSSWIKVSKIDVSVNANSIADLPFKIEIPTDAEPGEYRSAILVSLSPDSALNNGSSLSVSSYISSVLSIKVTGTTSKDSGARDNSWVFYLGVVITIILLIFGLLLIVDHLINLYLRRFRP